MPFEKKNIGGLWRNPSAHFSAVLSDPWYRTVSLLTSRIAELSMQHLTSKGLRPVLAPITSRSISSPMGLGSDSLPVQVPLFGEPVYLADSMQFGLEYLLRVHQAGTFYIMPTFRGEDPDERHLNEFFHAEAEITGHLNNVIDLVDGYVKHLSEGVIEAFPELARNTQLVDIARGSPIPRMTFAQALERLGSAPELYTFHEGKAISLSSRGERLLLDQVGTPVWVTHNPEIAVPFYQAVDTSSGVALNADLLMGIGETVGAGQRHLDLPALQRALDIRGNPAESYAWYLQMKNEFPIQTSGFGLGVERFLLWILQHDDIRDLELFVRTKGSKGLV